MLDTSSDAPNVPQAPEKWVSVSAAARALGVSEKTLRKRIKSGLLESKRVSLARGGAAYLVNIGTRFGTSKTGSISSSKTIGQNFQNESEIEVELEPCLNVKSSGLELGLESSISTSKPSSISMALWLEREAELKDEIRFLRGVIESDRRDMAEVRAALREALKLAPKQLASGETGNGLESPQNAPMNQDQAPTPNAAKSGANRAETVSYGALADWLEKEVG